jgi:hypothetical protein
MSKNEFPIKDACDYAYRSGFLTRKTGNDGLEGWCNIKKLFNKLYIEYEFNLTDKIIELSKLLSVYEGDKDLNSILLVIDSNDKERDFELLSNSIEIHHFVIQLLRIPLIATRAGQKTLSYLRVLQIAYNIGQATSVLDSGQYTQAIVDFIEKNDLFNMNTYVIIS